MKKSIQLIFPFLFLAGLTIGLWFLAKWLLESIVGFNSDVGAAITTGIIGLTGLLYAQWHSKSKEISDSHRPAKIEVYNTFFEITERFMSDAKLKKSELEANSIPDDLQAQFTKLSRGMIVWASPKVITAWSRFREMAHEEQSGNEILFAVDDVLQAIRKDLGNSNWGLKRGDVVKIYLSNSKDLV